ALHPFPTRRSSDLSRSAACVPCAPAGKGRDSAPERNSSAVARKSAAPSPGAGRSCAPASWPLICAAAGRPSSPSLAAVPQGRSCPGALFGAPGLGRRPHLIAEVGRPQLLMDAVQLHLDPVDELVQALSDHLVDRDVVKDAAQLVELLQGAGAADEAVVGPQ